MTGRIPATTSSRRGSPSSKRADSSSLVATTVVEDVVADGRTTVSELLVQRDDLEALKEAFLADQQRYQDLQAEVDAEVDNYTSLFEQADQQVAAAIPASRRRPAKRRQHRLTAQIAGGPTRRRRDHDPAGSTPNSP